VAVPYARARNERCAVRVLRAGLEAAGIHRGPVFRRMRRGDTVSTERLTGQSVALIVKRRSKAAGLGPEQLSGHSLRAGYVTAAASAGVYLNRGYIDPGLAGPVMLGVLFGSLIGARTLAGANTRVLRIVFGLVVAAMAVEMIASGLRGKI